MLVLLDLILNHQGEQYDKIKTLINDSDNAIFAKLLSDEFEPNFLAHLLSRIQHVSISKKTKAPSLFSCINNPPSEIENNSADEINYLIKRLDDFQKIIFDLDLLQPIMAKPSVSLIIEFTLTNRKMFKKEFDVDIRALNSPNPRITKTVNNPSIKCPDLIISENEGIKIDQCDNSDASPYKTDGNNVKKISLSLMLGGKTIVHFLVTRTKFSKKFQLSINGKQYVEKNVSANALPKRGEQLSDGEFISLQSLFAQAHVSLTDQQNEEINALPKSKEGKEEIPEYQKLSLD
jgi:hypothetical protein